LHVIHGSGGYYASGVLSGRGIVEMSNTNRTRISDLGQKMMEDRKHREQRPERKCSPGEVSKTRADLAKRELVSSVIYI
jgi:hypothetical protein